MAFRAPRYSYVHAFRERGIANLSLGAGAAHADFPLDNLIDDRAGLLFKMAATGTLELECDVTGFSQLARIIIPAGHNIDKECLVEQDTAADFPTPTVLATFTPTLGVQIDKVITASSQNFLRLRIVDTTKAWELSECIFTKVVTLLRGPNWLANPSDESRFNYTRLNQPTGISPTVKDGNAQRLLEYQYLNVDDVDGTDLTDLEAFIDAVGMDRPFWVDPQSFSTPPSTDEPALWMKFDTPPKSSNGSRVPTAGVRSKDFKLTFVESLD